MSYDYEIITITDTDSGDNTKNPVYVKLQSETETGPEKKLSSDNFNQGELFSSVLNGLTEGDAPLTTEVFRLDGKDAWSLNNTWVTRINDGQCFAGGGAWLDNHASKSVGLSQYNGGDSTHRDKKDSSFILTIKTANDDHAGTNNAVYIKLFDSYGNASTLTHIDQPFNDWQTGKTDTVEIRLPIYLSGPITRLMINKPGTQGWKPESISVKSKFYSELSTHFTINAWLDGEKRWWFGESDQ
ncbi:PLAT/LH2 domain-containing protein [Photobacterium sp. 1_MG-2023]|uniref:PLAT/LH2 domain-containing protein n=1 Tax=Photobacterium sp. 1_MG-2023 TaxID=3062646 RepID=UPI0026E31859|nr:PLAT/LH2 domain-containing protein [Photobacterium sp. 1_MG-2023]MDO6707272.1 PLAT/LH2 domain-containing protein [Photobacterium sp. 1_MG-2023]